LRTAFDDRPGESGAGARRSRIIASGTHEELLESEPLYSEILARAHRERSRNGLAAAAAPCSSERVVVERTGGAPFGGIPEELMDEATKLLASEPVHAKSDVHFTQRPAKRSENA